MKRHSYTRFCRPFKGDLDDIKAGTRTKPHRWEFGLIQYDVGGYGSNPDDTRAEHQIYQPAGLTLTLEEALAQMNGLELPEDAMPLHHESRRVGCPAAVWSVTGGGATPATRGHN